MKINCPSCLVKECKDITIKDGRCLQYATDNIKSSQHRFYRGLILPALTEALGESNNQYVHDFILKPEWIYRQIGKYYIPISCYADIPEKHRATARINSERVTIDKFGEPCTEIQFYGYVPSMANFTRAETKDFFKFCEVLLEEIGGAIPTDQNQEYKLLKKKVLK